MNYYIADTHFGHNNILRLSNRPFNTVEEMDKVIIDNWNSRVTDNDDVCKKYFIEIVDMKMVDDNGTQIVCCHYPMVEWDGYYRDVLHFYGHIHNNFDNETNQYISKVQNAYNVGVDIIGFMPRTLKEILESKNIMKNE